MPFAEVNKSMPRRALIVDDEPAVCQLIQGVLSSSGLDSLTLTKSADATGYLRDEKFDVVLLDFSMPAPSGIELAQQAWLRLQSAHSHHHD